MSILRKAVSVFACLAVFMPVSPAHADELPALFAFMPSFDMPASYTEFSNGISGTAQGWTGYASGTIGLSAPLHSDGWRLKFAGHYGQYRYATREDYICEKNESGGVQSNQTIRDVCEAILSPDKAALSAETEAFLNRNGYIVVDQNLARPFPHQANRYHLGIAPGYRLTLGDLTLKAYLGLAYQNETVTPDDDQRSSPDEVWGAEGVVEAWLQLGERSWMSLDSSYFTGAQSYSVEWKFGHWPLSWVSLGPELAAFGDRDGTSGRAGAFVRFDTGKVETTVSGGFTGTYKDDPSIYGAANFYVRF